MPDYEAMDAADGMPDVTVLTQERRKAVKQYDCATCTGTIMVGAVYEYVGGVTDGAFWINRICPTCLLERGLWARGLSFWWWW